jgi:hypothetical protein
MWIAQRTFTREARSFLLFGRQLTAVVVEGQEIQSEIRELLF